MLFERLPKTTRELVIGHLHDCYGQLGPLSSWSIDQVSNLLSEAARHTASEINARALIGLIGDMRYQMQRIKARKRPGFHASNS